jgi:hypothetical protein
MDHYKNLAEELHSNGNPWEENGDTFGKVMETIKNKYDHKVILSTDEEFLSDYGNQIFCCNSTFILTKLKDCQKIFLNVEDPKEEFPMFTVACMFDCYIYHCSYCGGKMPEDSEEDDLENEESEKKSSKVEEIDFFEELKDREKQQSQEKSKKKSLKMVEEKL